MHIMSCLHLCACHNQHGNECRELFEAWCEDPRNGIIIADFAVAGTLAREVLDEPKEIMSHSGHKVFPRVQGTWVAPSKHIHMLATFWDRLLELSRLFHCFVDIDSQEPQMTCSLSCRGLHTTIQHHRSS